jgi:hypothetical protein
VRMVAPTRAMVAPTRVHRPLSADLEIELAVSSSLLLTHPPESLARAEAVLAAADDWELSALVCK